MKTRSALLSLMLSVGLCLCGYAHAQTHPASEALHDLEGERLSIGPIVEEASWPELYYEDVEPTLESKVDSEPGSAVCVPVANTALPQELLFVPLSD